MYVYIFIYIERERERKDVGVWCDDLGALDNPRVDLRAVKVDQGRLVRELHLPLQERLSVDLIWTAKWQPLLPAFSGWIGSQPPTALPGWVWV